MLLKMSLLLCFLTLLGCSQQEEEKASEELDQMVIEQREQTSIISQGFKE